MNTPENNKRLPLRRLGSVDSFLSSTLNSEPFISDYAKISAKTAITAIARTLPSTKKLV